MPRRKLFLCILAFAFWPSVCWSALSYPDQYDWQFQKAAKMWLPGVDYRLLKAQCYQESLLNPKAVSPVGAKGLCQFMDFTWGEVSDALKFPPEATAFAPKLSITAAGYYMARMRGVWTSPRPETDRHSLALASYNAGAGNLIKAQKACGGPSLFSEIIVCLPDITGHYAKETQTYVRRIWTYFTQMILGY